MHSNIDLFIEIGLIFKHFFQLNSKLSGVRFGSRAVVWVELSLPEENIKTSKRTE
jgi:hypothetical protein